MSRTYIPAELRRLVTERAQGQCEYCLVHQDDVPFMHQVDHIRARKHGGQTASENLALACLDDNRHKGADLTAIDPANETITPLFNPRTQAWTTHFALAVALIVGLTPTGRATVALLHLNDPARVLQRQALMEAGRYPPAFRNA